MALKPQQIAVDTLNDKAVYVKKDGTQQDLGGGSGAPTKQQVYDLNKTINVAGTNVTITNDDSAQTQTFSASGSGGGAPTIPETYTNMVSILADGSTGLTWTKNNTQNTILATVNFPAPTKAQVYSLIHDDANNNINGIIQAGQNISITPGGGTSDNITIASTNNGGLINIQLTGTYNSENNYVEFTTATAISEFNKLRVSGETEFTTQGGLAGFLKNVMAEITGSMKAITIVEGQNTIIYSGIEILYLRGDETNPATNEGEYTLYGQFGTNTAQFVINSGTNETPKLFLKDSSGNNLNWSTSTNLSIIFNRNPFILDRKHAGAR